MRVRAIVLPAIVLSAITLLSCSSEQSDAGGLPVPLNRFPPDGITAWDTLSLYLAWNPVVALNGDSVRYDVCFGTVNPPATIISQNLSDTLDTVTGLRNGATYYWRVVARAGAEQVSGPVWRFSTSLPGYRLNDNEAQGWVSDTGALAFKIYMGDELYSRIDGGAIAYRKHGCVQTMIQQMTRADTLQLMALIMEFESADSAAAMYRSRQGSLYEPAVLPGYDSATAIAESGVLSGCMAYSRLGRFYLELGLSGHSDKVTPLEDAVRLLNAYRARMRL